MCVRGCRVWGGVVCEGLLWVRGCYVRGCVCEGVLFVVCGGVVWWVLCLVCERVGCLVWEGSGGGWGWAGCLVCERVSCGVGVMCNVCVFLFYLMFLTSVNESLFWQMSVVLDVVFVVSAKRLDLYQVLSPNAYSYREEFIPIIKKAVQSQVHEVSVYWVQTWWKQHTIHH